MNKELWPSLAYNEWKDSCSTLHMWMQIVGKIRLKLSPPLNHWWHVPLYITARGLSTSLVPSGKRNFEIGFDFIDHLLRIETADGGSADIRLEPKSVAQFYAELMEALEGLGLETEIWTRPVEIGEPIDFEKDHEHCSYDPDYANRFWRILLQSGMVMQQFRSLFTGKCSPVHFFWGSFDLAVTRFSGRPAPPHPGGIPNLADWVTREAYSHEVSSAGFWPGSEAMPEPMYYAYAYPEPEGFGRYPVRPAEAFYNSQMREFFLPYEAVRASADPEGMLMEFLQSSYEAAAELSRWDRDILEKV